MTCEGLQLKSSAKLPIGSCCTGAALIKALKTHYFYKSLKDSVELESSKQVNLTDGSKAVVNSLSKVII